MGAGPRWKDRGGIQGKLSSAHPGVAGQERKGEGGRFRWSGREDDGFKPNHLSSSHRTMTDAGSIGQSPCRLGSLRHYPVCFLPSPFSCVRVCMSNARCSAIAKMEITSAMKEEECAEGDSLPSSGPGGEKLASE